MTNVIQFPRPQSAKTLPLEEIGKMTRLFWADKIPEILKPFEDAEFPFLDVLRKLGKNPYLNGLQDINWGTLDIQMQVTTERDGEEEMCTWLKACTDVRPDLVPEFGEQTTTMFVNVTVDHARDEVITDFIPLTTYETPDNLLQNLVAYSMTFGEVQNSNKMQFAMAVLAELIDHPKLKFVEEYINRSAYAVKFYDPEQDMTYSYWFDFTPILLDACALAYFNTLPD